ncbi:protein kinase [Paenibacillus sp. N1-5-1-14]|uniref:serine/threonine protein kinase n=1 Tax=Paenibacillus radicibacter TaxID=2972488 RepID=UPI0021591594|nr:protein kinase [Paenibacillus radicibacter]MCR8645852.1 protein kinase [Paenibacillus radicibacter]
MTTLFNLDLRPGITLRGKWNGKLYTIERLIGAGANGQVYLVRSGKAQFALKIGFETVDHQSEINALRRLSDTSTSFRDMLRDVDDFVWMGKEYPFFVMKYIEGTSLTQFMDTHEPDWVYVIGLHLLSKLRELHEQGYVFGDLKMENVLVCAYGHVELVDFGGVTPIGKSVKQFTELYDRGFWGSGSRVAEPSYDLFSFAVLMIRAFDTGKKITNWSQGLPQNRSTSDLSQLLDEVSVPRNAKPVLEQMLQQRFSTAKEASTAWRQLFRHASKRKAEPVRGNWLSICFTASLVVFGLTLYLYWPR